MIDRIKATKMKQNMAVKAQAVIKEAQLCLGDHKFQRYALKLKDLQISTLECLKKHPKNDPQYSYAIANYINTLDTLEQLFKLIDTESKIGSGKGES